MSADILIFPCVSDTERNAMIERARANYESIFPRTPPTTDGGKARILRRRDNFKFRNAGPGADDPACDDLMMDHADPSDMPSDSPYHAPDSDPA